MTSVVRLVLGALISLSMLIVGNWITVMFTAGILIIFCVLEAAVLSAYEWWTDGFRRSRP